MEETTEKTCSRCGVTKPVADYYIRKGKPQAACKACILAGNRAYAKANPERGRAAAQRWRDRNPDKVRAQNVKWSSENRERHNARIREWRKANPASTARSTEKWLSKPGSREKVSEASRRWRHANREALAQWAAENRDKIQAKASKRRALIAKATIGKVDPFALWETQGTDCSLCHQPIDRSLRFPDRMSASLDHIVPLALGGAHSQENVAWSHLTCNAAKGARLPD